MKRLLRFQYPMVDQENRRVKIELVHTEEVIMTVHVDLRTQEMRKEGNLDVLNCTQEQLEGLFEGLFANATYILDNYGKD